MSIRTVVEINHDQLYRLLEDQDWAKQLYHCLCSDGWRETNRHREFLPPNGVRVLGQRHHSEELQLTVK